MIQPLLCRFLLLLCGSTSGIRSTVGFILGEDLAKNQRDDQQHQAGHAVKDGRKQNGRPVTLTVTE